MGASTIAIRPLHAGQLTTVCVLVNCIYSVALICLKNQYNYIYTTNTSPLIGQQLYDIQYTAPGMHMQFSSFFSFFSFFIYSSKEKRAMFDGTKTQSDGRNTEGALQQDG